MIGISVDPVENHHKWKADIEKLSGNKVDYPMIGDLATERLLPILFQLCGSELHHKRYAERHDY